MLNQSCVADQAHLRSHSGPGASEALSTCPSKPEFRIEAELFRTIILERLRLPHQVSEVRCECGAFLDREGRHRAACARSGRPQDTGPGTRERGWCNCAVQRNGLHSLGQQGLMAPCVHEHGRRMRGSTLSSCGVLWWPLRREEDGAKRPSNSSKAWQPPRLAMLHALRVVFCKFAGGVAHCDACPWRSRRVRP